jgi:hypothetical protein
MKGKMVDLPKEIKEEIKSEAEQKLRASFLWKLRHYEEILTDDLKKYMQDDNTAFHKEILEYKSTQLAKQIQERYMLRYSQIESFEKSKDFDP